MLTDDGKHLYVSWDEYHLLIERLALKVHALGLGVRPDPVPGARRHAARRRAVAGVRQAAGDHVDQLLPRRSRHDPGPARHGEVHHHAQGRTGRAGAAGGRPGRHRHDAAAVVERLRGMPSISELRSAVLWVKGVSTYTPDYFVEMLPTSPWIHQPFEEYDGLRPEGLAKKFARD
jgi:hypothetical protein